MHFFVGLHEPAHAIHFERAFISVNRVRARRSPVRARSWILDSGSFTTINTWGGYPRPVDDYAAVVQRFVADGNLLAAVSQDYMCEPNALRRTGLSVLKHQRLTIERYDALVACRTGAYIMPVLQGYAAGEYVDHLEQYGDRIERGAWVGVGSVCKRNGTPMSIVRVLMAINIHRPDLRLHGFGVKLTALGNPLVRSMLHSADSMAWSFAARMQGRDANDWREAHDYAERVESMTS
jgi:hypothetical protein